MTRSKKTHPLPSPAAAPLPAAAAHPHSPAAAEGRERIADQLLRLAGRRVHETLDPRDPAHADYFEWAAAEARAARGPAERSAIDAEARAFARRVTAAMADAVAPDRAESGSMRLVLGAPTSRAAVEGASGRAAVRAAADARCAAWLELAVSAGVGRELWDEPCTAWVELPDDVADGQHVALPVHGDSMEPLLHAGDTLLVRVGAAVSTGDVIVARRPEDGYVVKRVAAIEERALVLASANAAYADLRIPRDESLVVGTVVLRWCAHRAARA